MNILTTINKAWSWLGILATEVIRTNEFGNIIFKTENNTFWHICPEELSCKLIAKDETELNNLLNDDEFIEDFEMNYLTTTAKTELGELQDEEKYCLKLPAVIGGEYKAYNMGKITFPELIQFAGDIAFQIKDLKDGQQVNLKII